MIIKNDINRFFGDLFVWFFGLLVVFLLLEWWHAGFVASYINLNWWFITTLVLGGVHLSFKNDFESRIKN